MCSYGMADFGFFVECLREVCRMAGLREWEGVRRILEGFLWEERACKKGAGVVWGVVERGLGEREEGEGC